VKERLPSRQPGERDGGRLDVTQARRLRRRVGGADGDVLGRPADAVETYERINLVAGLHFADAGGDRLDHAGDFVPGDDERAGRAVGGRVNRRPGQFGPGDRAGVNPDERVARFQRRRGRVLADELLRAAPPV
jgi:hypothetical protein